ncbi:hypothetical protein LC1Hm_1404 [Halomicrobium sp. LC1Hm]|nr:hypothetical protein LC1Hm_1404 [Halomicrobium sp. LC1Hm]
MTPTDAKALTVVKRRGAAADWGSPTVCAPSLRIEGATAAGSTVGPVLPFGVD